MKWDKAKKALVQTTWSPPNPATHCTSQRPCQDGRVFLCALVSVFSQSDVVAVHSERPKTVDKSLLSFHFALDLGQQVDGFVGNLLCKHSIYSGS